MGWLVYDSHFEADFEDRLLAHLQVVIGGRLARGESFFFSWRDSVFVGGGRTCLWLHPAVSLRFRYSTRLPAGIDPEWVRRLTADSYASGGLRVAAATASARAVPSVVWRSAG